VINLILDAAEYGFDFVPSEAGFVELDQRSRDVAAHEMLNIHLTIHTINQTLFAGQLLRGSDRLRSKNAVILFPGRIDHSPCETGKSARLALLHARGEIAEGEVLEHVSVRDTEFISTVCGITTCGDLSAINLRNCSQALITKVHQNVLDPMDSFPTGFRLKDTW
jgi:proline racemase